MPPHSLRVRRRALVFSLVCGWLSFHGEVWTSNKPLMRSSPGYFPQFWGGKKWLCLSDRLVGTDPKLRMNIPLSYREHEWYAALEMERN